MKLGHAMTQIYKSQRSTDISVMKAQFHTKVKKKKKHCSVRKFRNRSKYSDNMADRLQPLTHTVIVQ